MKMRSHLYRCLEAGRITPFPHKKLIKFDSDDNLRINDDYDGHCHYRIPKMKNVPMIECSKCNNWFQTRCESVSESTLDKSEIGSTLNQLLCTLLLNLHYSIQH